MKRILVLLSFAIFTSIACLAQKAEVLYFKAALPCCQAVACNNLEASIKATIEKNFSNGEVVFTTVKLNDPANNELIKKHQAGSQTVILISKNGKTETIADVSNLVKSLARNKSNDDFEAELVASIKNSMK